MFKQEYRRHDLLRVRADAWRSALDTVHLEQFDTRQRQLVEYWARNAWPVIVGRRDEADRTDHLPVGLPLPPSLGKTRIRVLLPHHSIERRIPPVSLRDAIESAPLSRRMQLNAIHHLGNRLGTRPAVFGSFMWQHVTGLPYVEEGSDIDLLWRMSRGARLRVLLDELDRLDSIGPVRIDGEVLFVGGDAVNWRELARERRIPNGTVLVKSMEKAELRCAQTFTA